MQSIDDTSISCRRGAANAAARKPLAADMIENPQSKAPDAQASSRFDSVRTADSTGRTVHPSARTVHSTGAAAVSRGAAAGTVHSAAGPSDSTSLAAAPARCALEESTPTILHLRTVTGQGGGPEKTLLASPKHIGPRYRLRLAYIRPANDALYDMPARAQRAGATLIDVPERGGADPRTWSALVREIKHSRPALLHPHDYKTNILAVLLGKRFGLPVVTTMHGFGLPNARLKLYFRLERWALRRMDRVICVSPDLLEYAVKIGVPSERCKLVDNAIDLEQFTRRATVEEAKKRLGLSPERLLMGAVGRLFEEKGFDRLIAATGRLSGPAHETHPRVPLDLVIVGEGPERGALERLIRQRGLEDRVRLAGHQTDTIAWFEAMDIFALSSLREGLPNVLLEAMALEVPVVATRVGGVPGLVSDGESGLLVKPDDVDGLTTAIRTLAETPNVRRRLAAAARKAIETGYSFEKRMEKIRGIYDEVLGATVE